MKKTILLLLSVITFSVAKSQDTSKIQNIPKEMKEAIKQAPKDTMPPKIYYLFPITQQELEDLFAIIKSGVVALDLKPTEQSQMYNKYAAKIQEYIAPKVDSATIKKGVPKK